MERYKVNASVILSVVLFLGGLVLLLFHPPFWGTLLGVPAIIFGIVFIVLTFDKLNQLTLEDEER